jgi:hypothetical protein
LFCFHKTWNNKTLRSSLLLKNSVVISDKLFII